MVLKSKQQKESYFNFEARLSYHEVTSVIVILMLQKQGPNLC